MDKQSGESKEEEVIDEGIGESEVEELLPEWGWRRDRVNYRDTVKHTEQKGPVVLRKGDVGGRARVTTDEEIVLYEDIEQRWGYKGMEVG